MIYMVQAACNLSLRTVQYQYNCTPVYRYCIIVLTLVLTCLILLELFAFLTTAEQTACINFVGKS